MKKNLVIIILIILVVIFGVLVIIEDNTFDNKLSKPEISEGVRGEFGIDKNINESTLDKYLNRQDVVYRDVRMLKDEANYENIGGDSYLSGFVKGFEVIPYPYLVNVTGLPEEVGDTYKGDTLFKYENGTYIPNYKESMDILEYIFPKDKIIFLMCGGGGYAGMTKNMLISLGWDSNKIYNVGGYWNYDGNNSIKVKRTENGKDIYDFWKVNYHDINFDFLSKVE